MKHLMKINFALVLLLLTFSSWAQKTDTITINVSDRNLAKITPVLYDTNTIELNTFDKVYLKVINSDTISFKVVIRNNDTTLDSITLNPNNTSGKQLQGVVKKCKCSKISIGFDNDTIKFSIGALKDTINSITIVNTSASTKSLINCDSTFNFIPAIYNSSKGKWPNYVCSTNENIKYRFAIDFSKSFSQASLWKLKKRKWFLGNDTLHYKLKNTISPRHLRFMTMSVKNYYPQYDSIVTSTAFNSLNLEGRSAFEKYEKQVIASMKGYDSSSVDLTPFGTSVNSVKENTVKPLFNKLNSDLNKYSNYLSRNIIDKSIWFNDIQYINSKLNQCFGLTDYSANGLLLSLKEYSKDNKFKGKDELIHSIIISYASIQNYSILSTSPIQIKDKDVLTYNLDFYKAGKKVETRDYSFLIKGGFKIDYSSGFAYSSLKDESYQIIDKGTRTDTTFYRDKYNNTTDSITDITSTKLKGISLLNKDINIGVTALMHFYSRTGTLVNWGGTFGFMLNTRAEFNYLLGGSLIFGQNQRFILSGGASIGQVNRLNPKYSTSEIYTENQLEQVSDSQLTIKKWDIGYFIGISYNLGNIK